MALLELGVGRAVITPPLGTSMAGFAHRTHGAESVLDDLELRLFWFRSEGAPSPVCVVTADLIGFGPALVRRIRQSLCERVGIDPSAVMLAASHTHSGPHACENVDDGAGRPDPAYLDTLVESIAGAAAHAKAATQPVHLDVAFGRLSGYAINRRRVVNGKARMAPNPGGVRDDEVTLFLFRAVETHAPIGLLVHYTCHPTTLGTYQISAEYPGAARRGVEAAMAGVTCGFLPGCFGDVRPACTVLGGDAFRQGTPQDVAAFGRALADETLRALERPALRRTEASLKAIVRDVALPLEREPDGASLSLQRVDFASDVSLLAMGGEVCVEYGQTIKRMRPGRVTVPVGYANGMVGYIPTAEMFASGGYEPVDSVRYFGLSSPFKSELEERIYRAVSQILAE